MLIDFVTIDSNICEWLIKEIKSIRSYEFFGNPQFLFTLAKHIKVANFFNGSKKVTKIYKLFFPQFKFISQHEVESDDSDSDEISDDSDVLSEIEDD